MRADTSELSVCFTLKLQGQQYDTTGERLKAGQALHTRCGGETPPTVQLWWVTNLFDREEFKALLRNF